MSVSVKTKDPMCDLVDPKFTEVSCYCYRVQTIICTDHSPLLLPFRQGADARLCYLEVEGEHNSV